MALKTVKVCTECENSCKQQVDEKIVDKADLEKKNILVSCPRGNKFKRKKSDKAEKVKKVETKAKPDKKDKEENVKNSPRK